MENTLTQGTPYKKIIRFTIPLLLGNLIQQLYYTADAYIVSRTLGVEAFAGVSSTSGITSLIIGFAQGLTVGLSILVSKHFGAKDMSKVQTMYVNNMLISLLAAVLLTVMSLFGISTLLNILQTPSDIWQYAHDFLQIIFLGIITSVLFNFFSNTMRALGDSRTPFIYLLIGAVLNIFLDVILVKYTSLGVQGAALATILSQGAAAVLCLMSIRKKYTFLSLKGYKKQINKEIIFSNLKLGLPVAFQASIIALGVIIMQYAVNDMGTVAVAAYAVASRIEGMAVEPLRSFGMAMTTFTAQNYGGYKYKRIIKGVHQCLLISIGMAIALGVMMLFGGRQLTALFVGKSQSEILELSHTFLIIHGSLYMILSFLFVYRFTLQGLGKSSIPTISGVMELVMRIVAAILLVPSFGFIGATIATPLSWIGALIPSAVAYFIASKHLKKQLSSNEVKNVMREY
ncbi:MATE family efflux transporter [Terribacillus saccharophilus]|uniref:MATE family efflux transporter n=1 Tax=Terribacillus saccharophilus TaxID=361277 RepID=UPI002DC48E43|nr:MATE family efflux transporter [Terribacillus saccharophilus]